MKKEIIFVTTLILLLAIPEVESKGRSTANAAQKEQVAAKAVQEENIEGRGYFLYRNSAYMIDVDGDGVPEVIRTSEESKKAKGFGAYATETKFKVTVSNLKNQNIGRWEETFQLEQEELMSVYFIDIDKDGNLELWVVTSTRVYSLGPVPFQTQK